MQCKKTRLAAGLPVFTSVHVAIAHVHVPPAVPGVNPAPATAVIEVRIEPEAVDAVIPIKRISVVDTTESIPPVKPAEAMGDEPATAEVETSETTDVDATKSVESTKVGATEMASSEVTTPEMTTAEMATAGIRDLGQRDKTRDERRGYERDKLHDTLLLDGDLLVATEVLRKWRSCGFFSRIYRSRLSSQCPHALRSRHDGIAGEPMLDHVPVPALADHAALRLDLNAQRRAHHARARRVVLCRGESRKSGGREREHRKTRHRSAHGAPPVRLMFNVSHHGAVVNHAL
jgi:hypothetical protein